MPKKYLLLAIAFLLKSVIVTAQLKVGDKAPEIHITNWIRNQPQSKDLSGKFIIVDFWATWCAPCLESIPHMNNLINKNKSRSNLVFLSITDEKEDKVNWLLNRVDFSSIVVSDVTRQTFDDYKIKFIPLCVVIDDKNVIQWIGNPGELNSETISAIIDRKSVPLSPEKKQVLVSEEVSKMYASLTNRFATYYNDQDLKEYFSVSLSLFKGKRAFINQHGDTHYNELIIADSLARRISVFLDISDNQVILPGNLARSYISYCYKSEKKITKKQVFNTILDHLNLEYTVSDSLIDVIQLEVIDKKNLKKFVADSMPHISRTSFSESYAAIDNEHFSLLVREIQDRFEKVVVVKHDNILDNKMSMTVKSDNFQNLAESLQSYGIKVTLIKKKMPVYRFTQKK